jgi:preprotein translocase subunit SecB
MKYKISYSYNWYETKTDRFIIKTYYINDVAFTFDEVPSIFQDHPEIIIQANKNLTYNPEYFYQKSFYLMNEECHPLIFELDLENPEMLEELDTEV